jgi:hypothetical protein
VEVRDKNAWVGSQVVTNDHLAVVFMEYKGAVVYSHICHNFGSLAVSKGGVGEPPLGMRHPSQNVLTLVHRVTSRGTHWVKPHHALRLNDRVCHINLNVLASILCRVLVLMDQHFPMLEHLSLSFADFENPPPTLPKAFLAPNLRHIALPGISHPRILQFLTSTVSLVTLKLSSIQPSSYFCLRLLVARLRPLSQLEELDIEFSAHTPLPSTERELSGEQGTPVTLPSLKNLRFYGISAYLESLIAQVKAPLLEWLNITLPYQIVFALPHLSHVINITELFKCNRAVVSFHLGEVSVTTADYNSPRSEEPCFLRVMCNSFSWKIGCAAQICNALIPALSTVERLTLSCYFRKYPTELQDGAIDATAWLELLRSFIVAKEIHIDRELLDELSCVLQVDEVGLDPGFLPNLRSIHAPDNLFTSFIDTRQVVGRPVEFVEG